MTNTVSITNTGCIRCDNRCREHLEKMFLFFDSFPVCIGICENHTGQIDLFLFFDLFQKEGIDLDFFLQQYMLHNCYHVILACVPGLFTSTHTAPPPNQKHKKYDHIPHQSMSISPPPLPLPSLPPRPATAAAGGAPPLPSPRRR